MRVRYCKSFPSRPSPGFLFLLALCSPQKAPWPIPFITHKGSPPGGASRHILPPAAYLLGGQGLARVGKSHLVASEHPEEQASPHGCREDGRRPWLPGLHSVPSLKRPLGLCSQRAAGSTWIPATFWSESQQLLLGAQLHDAASATPRKDAFAFGSRCEPPGCWALHPFLSCPRTGMEEGQWPDDLRPRDALFLKF